MGKIPNENKFCYVAGKKASVAGYCSTLPSCLSFDLCCKLIIISEDDITAEIKDLGDGP